METSGADPITLRERSLVLLVGPTGAGKTTFARRRFEQFEVLSSDAFRSFVAGDENDQAASADAFEALHLIADARLRRGRFTVVDATNLRASARARLLALAARRRVPVVAIVFDIEPAVLIERSRSRTDRRLPPDVLDRQRRLLEQALVEMPDEPIAAIHVLRSVAEVDRSRIVRIGRRRLQTSDTDGSPPGLRATGGAGFALGMNEEQIYDRINRLAKEEEQLYAQAGDGTGLDDGDERRLRDIEVQLDQAYDLLAQRRARRDVGQDPDGAAIRPADTVEHYQQ